MQLEFLRKSQWIHGSVSGALAGVARPTVYIPLLLTATAAVCFHLTELDLIVARLAYDAAATTWPCLQAEPWLSIYRFGCFPSLVLGIGGLVVALLGGVWAPARSIRKEGLFLAVFLVLGPGLLVNTVLKPNWARPRPIELRAFGGDRDFLPVGVIGSQSGSKSFPSGHAAMGFFLMAPGFVLLRRNRRMAHMFFALGLLGGGVMGITRIVQGGHFISDILASGALVYFTGLVLYFTMGLNRPLVRREEPEQPEGVSDVPRRRQAA